MRGEMLAAGLGSPIGILLAITDATGTPILPATQTVAFGGKTLRGHGGSDLQYTGTKLLKITSGNTGGVWMIDDENQLVIVFTTTGSTVYGSQPPSLSSSYSLDVEEYEVIGGVDVPTGVTGTVTVNVIPYAFHVRPKNGSPTHADTASSFQLKSVWEGTATGAVNIGDTIFLRDADYNFTVYWPKVGGGYEIVELIYPSGGWSSGSGSAVDYFGNPCVRITSDTPDTTTTNPDGHLMRGGGARIGMLSFSGPANVTCPAVFEYVTFYLDVDVPPGGNAITGQCYYRKGYGGGNYSRGISFYRCRNQWEDLTWGYYAGVKGLELRYGYAIECYSTHTGFAFYAGGDNVHIVGNVGYEIIQDFCQCGGRTTNIVFTDNFDYNRRSAWVDDPFDHPHPDGIQFSPDGNNSINLPTPELGVIERNIWVYGSLPPGDKSTQGIWLNPINTGGSYWTGFQNGSVRNNIHHGTYGNGMVFKYCYDTESQFNLTLHANSGGNVSPACNYACQSTCVGGIYNYNVSNTVGLNATGGATLSPHKTLNWGNDSYYTAAFQNFAGDDIRTRAQAITSFAPIRDKLVSNGGLMESDGRYNGPLFPADSNGVISWNDGTVFVFTDPHTPAT